MSQNYGSFYSAKEKGPQQSGGGLMFQESFTIRASDDVAIDKVLTDKDADEISFG